MTPPLQPLTRWGPRALIPASLTLCLLATAGPALAAWTAPGNGAAGAAATTMPAGNTPTLTTSGSNITVRWPAATLPSGAGVEGYTIARYNAINGAAATVGTACSGEVTSTTCTETGVPPGSWVYTDTPVQGNWTGPASPPSPPATLGMSVVSPSPTTSPSSTARPSPSPSPSPPARPSPSGSPSPGSLGSRAGVRH